MASLNHAHQRTLKEISRPSAYVDVDWGSYRTSTLPLVSCGYTTCTPLVVALGESAGLAHVWRGPVGEYVDGLVREMNAPADVIEAAPLPGRKYRRVKRRCNRKGMKIIDFDAKYNLFWKDVIVIPLTREVLIITAADETSFRFHE